MIEDEALKRWRNNDIPDINIQRQWYEHVHGDNKFPRDVGLPNRFSVYDPKEYVETIEKNRMNSNCYTSVYSIEDRRDSRYNTAFMDFDGEIPNEASEQKFDEVMQEVFWEVKKLGFYLSDKFGYEPRVYFSGGRGFAVYIDFVSTEVESYSYVETMLRNFVKEANLNEDIVDTKVFEPNRISRIPYTLNVGNFYKRGMKPMICLPVKWEWSTERMLDQIKKIEEPISVESCIEKSEEISKHLSSITVDYKSGERNKYEGNIELEDVDIDALEAYKEITKIKNDLSHKINDGRKRILFSRYIPLLVYAGIEDIDTVHRECKEFIENTGIKYTTEYSKYVENSLPSILEGPDGNNRPYLPKSWDQIFRDNRDILDEVTDDAES